MWYVRFLARRGGGTRFPFEGGKIHAYGGPLVVPSDPVVASCGRRAAVADCDFHQVNPLLNLRRFVCRRCLPAIEAERAAEILSS